MIEEEPYNSSCCRHQGTTRTPAFNHEKYLSTGAALSLHPIRGTTIFRYIVPEFVQNVHPKNTNYMKLITNMCFDLLLPLPLLHKRCTTQCQSITTRHTPFGCLQAIEMNVPCISILPYLCIILLAERDKKGDSNTNYMLIITYKPGKKAANHQHPCPYAYLPANITMTTKISEIHPSR